MRGARRHYVVGALATLALATTAAPAAPQVISEREPWRPPPLEATAVCDVWTGTGHAGNDPSQLVEMRLCGRADHVTGLVQYSALHAGWSARSLEGDWTEGRQRFTGHELAI